MEEASPLTHGGLISSTPGRWGSHKNQRRWCKSHITIPQNRKSPQPPSQTCFLKRRAKGCLEKAPTLGVLSWSFPPSSLCTFSYRLVLMSS